MIVGLMIILISAVVALLVYVLLSRTDLRINLASGRIWPLLLYRDLLVVILPVVLVSVYGVSAFPGVIVYADDGTAALVGIVTFFAVVVFALTIGVASRFLPLELCVETPSGDVAHRRVRRFALAAVVVGLVVLSIGWLFLGYKHAFASAIATGDSVISARLHNSYLSRLPTQLSFLVIFGGNIAAIYSGYSLFRGQYYTSLQFGILALLLCSARGDKAPVLMCFLLISFSYFAGKGFRASSRAIVYALGIGAPLLYFAAFLVVSLQFSGISLSEFNLYLLFRLGVGQMGGLYETLAIERLDGEFFWHMIPFARLFVDYVPYDKALMLRVEDYAFDEMGVKNSFFLSEAFGIGGWGLLLVSPVIVGVSYVLGIRILDFALRFLFSREVAAVYVLPLYLLSSSLSGGFSSFVFFKGLLLLLLSLGVVWVASYFMRIRVGSLRIL